MIDFLEYRLCFVDPDERTAWFTDAPITDVRGSDFDDAPHHCNAGTPYPDQGQHFVTVMYDPGEYDCVGCMPADRYGYLSVKQINSGDAPWFDNARYDDTVVTERLMIPAGVTLRQFAILMARGDGAVFYPMRFFASLNEVLP